MVLLCFINNKIVWDVCVVSLLFNNHTHPEQFIGVNPPKQMCKRLSANPKTLGHSCSSSFLIRKMEHLSAFYHVQTNDFWVNLHRHLVLNVKNS